MFIVEHAGVQGTIVGQDSVFLLRVERKHGLLHEREQIGPQLRHGHERLLHEREVLEDGLCREIGRKLDIAEGLLAKSQKEVAGLNMEGAIVQHEVGLSGRAIADSEKRGLHRLCVSGQRGQVFHDEQFVVEQFRSQGVGAHVLQRHAVGFVAANSRRSRRVVHHIVVLGVSTTANVQSFWGVSFLFSEQIGKKRSTFLFHCDENDDFQHPY